MDKKKTYVAVGAGTPVVLLHCGMSSKAQWMRLAQQCQDDFLMIAIDLMGYGDQPFPHDPAGHSLKVEQIEIEFTLAHLIPANRAFHLVGHGIGGALALRMAHTLKNRIRSFTLVDPLSFHVLDREEVAYKYVKELSYGLQNTALRTNCTRHYFDFMNGQGRFDALPPRFQESMAEQFPKLWLDVQAAINEPLTLSQCCAIRQPAMILSGKESPPLLRSIGAVLEMVMPNAVRHTVEGGHMSPITHGDQVNPLIAGFLRECEAAAMAETTANGNTTQRRRYDEDALHATP